MARTQSLVFRLSSFLALLPGPVLAAESAAPRAFVLDSAGPAVVALDMATGATLATAPLQGVPERMLRAPGGSRLVVLEPGPGKETLRFGFHPAGKSWASVIDAASLKVVSRVELGWNLGPVPFTRDGSRATVLCPGYRSQKPEETLAAELLNVDLASGNVTGRLALARRVGAILTSPDGKTGIVFSAFEKVKDGRPLPAEAEIIDLSGPQSVSRIVLEGEPATPALSPDARHVAFLSKRQTPKNAPALPASLQLLDVGARQLAATLKLEGDPTQLAFSPEGKYLYLLEKGNPSKKPEKNVNGLIQVVSLETRTHERNLAAGSDPRGFIEDKEGGQLLMLSDGPVSRETGKPEGELRLLKEGDIAATLKVAAQPMFVRITPDRKTLYVVGQHGVSHVDFVSLRTVAETPLNPAGVNILSADAQKHTVSELAFTDDCKRGFALYAGSSKLTVLDLDSKKVVGSVTTGRGGKKFGKFMGALALSVAMSAASQSVARQGAISTGSRYYSYNVYNYQIAPANTSLAVRPDGKFAYALNTQTNDVTIVDAETAQVVDKVPADGTAVKLLTGGTTLSVRSKNSLTFIDTASNKKSAELQFAGAKGLLEVLHLVFSPDGQHALAAAGSQAYALDGATGKVRTRVTGIKFARQVIVEAPEAQAADEEAEAEEPGEEAEPPPEALPPNP